ncbi:MAG: DUF2934 domain-containing protein [Thermoleophilia bacterium]
MARSPRKAEAAPKAPKPATTRRRKAAVEAPPAAPPHDEIARLAYELWLADGSRTPEQNWLAAESRLAGAA